MRTVGVLCFGEDLSEGPTGDPDEISSSEGLEDAETSPPCDASLWFLGSNSTSMDNFLGFMVQELVGHGITTMLPRTTPVASPLFTFKREMLVHVLHRTQADRK